MLGRKNGNEQLTKIGSIIGADAVVVGNLTTAETTRIEGKVQGDIKSSGTLIIGTGGKVTGNVEAAYIMVAGEVDGDLYVSGKTEVSSSGKVIGNIHTKSLVVDENAVFQGQCIMNVNEKQPDKALPDKEQPDKETQEEAQATA